MKKQDWNKIKENMKDWFIIQRIRILNFIKEHKYISVLISVFILSCIVALVAFAEDTPTLTVTEYKLTATNSAGNVVNNDDINAIVYSFDTVAFNISNLKFDTGDNDLALSKLNIEARVDSVNDDTNAVSTLDAYWVAYDEIMSYPDEENKKKAVYTINSASSTGSYNVYLKVNNVKQNTKIRVKFILNKEQLNDGETNEQEYEIIVNNKKDGAVSLVPSIRPGYAYKVDNFSGRYVPFGITLGIHSNLVGENLKGIYFEPNTTIEIETSEELLIGENNKEYFGFYNASLGLINIPNYKYDTNYENSVYNSGISLELEKTGDVTSDTNETVKGFPSMSLIGSKQIELKVNEKYIEYGIKIDDKIYKTSEGNLTVNSEDVDTSEEGEYEVTYTYEDTSKGISITVTRGVIVEGEKDTIIIYDEETEEEYEYEICGNENYTFLKSDNYKYEEDENAEGLCLVGDPTEVLSLSDLYIDGTSDDTSAVITYRVEAGSEETLTRTIKYVDSYEENELPKVEASFSTKEDSKLTVDNSIVSNPSYEDDENNRTYTYEGDIYKYEITGVINNGKSKKYSYKLHIKGISTDDIYYENDEKVILGSYFVTMASKRASGDESDIPVFIQAKVNNSSADYQGINYYQSLGTRKNELSINKEVDNELVKLTDDDYLAYGEEAVIKSLFTYSKDGDESISVENTIPVGVAKLSGDNQSVPFEMIEYSKNIGETTTTPYFVESTSKVEVKYGYCNLVVSNGMSSCNDEINWGDYDPTNKNLAYIKYIAEEVKPGSQIDFRIRVKTGLGNNLVTLSPETKVDGALIQNEDTKVNVNIFKVEANVKIDGKSGDNIYVDGANKNQSTMEIYPHISLPAGIVNTNIAGVNEIDYFNFYVILDDKLTHVPNSNYETPITSIKFPEIDLPFFKLPAIEFPLDGFLYIRTKELVNAWIEPILLDFSYATDIQNEQKLNINIAVEAVSENNGSETKKVIAGFAKTITYINNESISYSQIASPSYISKDESFNVSINTFNRSNEVQNYEVVTLLPPNFLENEYEGSYEILSGIEEGALCTEEPNITKEMFNKQEIWGECSKYSDENYSSVTAVKTKYEGVEIGKSNKVEYEIEVADNTNDDKYKFVSYLINGDSIKTIGENIVTVISKTITGVVWEDFDGNGIMDQSENKVSGVSLSLYDATDELITTTTSDENGKYSFSDLQPGNYYVTAEFNSAKYGLSPYREDIYDKSIKSSFKSYSEEVIVPYTEEDLDNNDSEEDSEECIDEDCYFEEDDEECEGEDCSSEVEDECIDGECDSEEDEEIEEPSDTPIEDITLPLIKTNIIEVTEGTKTISNINLGLALRKTYTIKLRKYITKAVTTNALGVSNTKDFGNVTLAKLDVKDINNLNIKVVYTIELENTGYYPGYIYSVKDFIPDGMQFNENYEENKGWILNSDGYLENNTLFDELIKSGEKKYLTVAFDITRKEAGSFVNYAAVDDEDLHILAVGESEGGNENE